MKEKNPRFEIYFSPKNAKQPWGWRLYARNGEIVASGEGHTYEKDAARAVRAVKRAVQQIAAKEAK